MTANSHDATASSTRQDDRLQGRIAVITDSSSGLGRAMAIEFTSTGARIVCADLRSDARPMAAHEVATYTHPRVDQRGL